MVAHGEFYIVEDNSKRCYIGLEAKLGAFDSAVLCWSKAWVFLRRKRFVAPWRTECHCSDLIPVPASPRSPHFPAVEVCSQGCAEPRICEGILLSCLQTMFPALPKAQQSQPKPGRAGSRAYGMAGMQDPS